MNELARGPSPPSQPIPYGVASLWDMLNFHAAKFVEVINTMADIERMLAFDASKLATGQPDPAPTLAAQLRWLEAQTAALALPVTLASVKVARFGAENPKKYDAVQSGNQMLKNLQEIRSRLADELMAKDVYLIPAKNHLQDADGSFGDAVSAAFPSADLNLVSASPFQGRRLA